jgi:hypothetical protein
VTKIALSKAEVISTNVLPEQIQPFKVILSLVRNMTEARAHLGQANYIVTFVKLFHFLDLEKIPGKL